MAENIPAMLSPLIPPATLEPMAENMPKALSEPISLKLSPVIPPAMSKIAVPPMSWMLPAPMAENMPAMLAPPMSLKPSVPSLSKAPTAVLPAMPASCS